MIKRMIKRTRKKMSKKNSKKMSKKNSKKHSDIFLYSIKKIVRNNEQMTGNDIKKIIANKKNINDYFSSLIEKIFNILESVEVPKNKNVFPELLRVILNKTDNDFNTGLSSQKNKIGGSQKRTQSEIQGGKGEFLLLFFTIIYFISKYVNKIE